MPWLDPRRQAAWVTAWLAVSMTAVLLAGCGSAGQTTPSPNASAPAATTSTATPAVTSSPLAASTSPSAEPSAKASSKQTDAPASAAVPSTPPATTAAEWRATGKMNKGHAYHTATLLPDGKVLVAGGESSADDDGKASRAAELYDPTSGKWTATGNLLQARWDHTATLLPDGRVLVVGGQSNPRDQLDSAELYDPSSGQWTRTASMHKVRSGHTATLLPDGKVLVTGGYDWAGAQAAEVEMMGLALAELYDPATGQWTPTGSMAEAQAGHTATLLLDGRVLVTGGIGSTDAELYDPGTGRWTVTGSMADSRRDHTATLMPDGTVLVTGGFYGSGYTVPPYSDVPGPCSAELYSPASGRWTATGTMHETASGTRRPSCRTAWCSSSVSAPAPHRPPLSCTTRTPVDGRPPRARRRPVASLRRCCSMAGSSRRATTAIRAGPPSCTSPVPGPDGAGPATSAIGRHGQRLGSESGEVTCR